MANNWFARLVDPAAPEVSLRHVGYASGVAGSLAWLTIELVKRGMSETWVAAYLIFMGAVVTGKIIGAQQGKAAAVTNAENDAGDPPAQAQEAPKE